MTLQIWPLKLPADWCMVDGEGRGRWGDDRAAAHSPTLAAPSSGVWPPGQPSPPAVHCSQPSRRLARSAVCFKWWTNKCVSACSSKSGCNEEMLCVYNVTFVESMLYIKHISHQRFTCVLVESKVLLGTDSPRLNCLIVYISQTVAASIESMCTLCWPRPATS